MVTSITANSAPWPLSLGVETANNVVSKQPYLMAGRSRGDWKERRGDKEDREAGRSRGREGRREKGKEREKERKGRVTRGGKGEGTMERRGTR